MRGLAGLVQRRVAETPRAREPKPSPGSGARSSTATEPPGSTRVGPVLTQRCAVRCAALLLFCIAIAALVAATGAPPLRTTRYDAVLLADMLRERTIAFAELSRVQESANADAEASALGDSEAVRSAQRLPEPEVERVERRARGASPHARRGVVDLDVASFPEPRSAEERETFEAFVEARGGRGAPRSSVVAAMGSMTARPPSAFDALSTTLLLKFVRWSLLPIAQRRDSAQHLRSETARARRKRFARATREEGRKQKHAQARRPGGRGGVKALRRCSCASTPSLFRSHTVDQWPDVLALSPKGARAVRAYCAAPGKNKRNTVIGVVARNAHMKKKLLQVRRAPRPRRVTAAAAPQAPRCGASALRTLRSRSNPLPSSSPSLSSASHPRRGQSQCDECLGQLACEAAQRVRNPTLRGGSRRV